MDSRSAALLPVKASFGDGAVLMVGAGGVVTDGSSTKPSGGTRRGAVGTAGMGTAGTGTAGTGTAGTGTAGVTMAAGGVDG